MPLKLVATSKVSSANGKANISLTRKSPLGVLARAIFTSASAASNPVTTAPRVDARWAANPDPQAMSRRRTSAATPKRSNNNSFAGRAYGSSRCAHSTARAPQPRPASAQPTTSPFAHTEDRISPARCPYSATISNGPGPPASGRETTASLASGSWQRHLRPVMPQQPTACTSPTR